MNVSGGAVEGVQTLREQPCVVFSHANGHGHNRRGHQRTWSENTLLVHSRRIVRP